MIEEATAVAEEISPGTQLMLMATGHIVVRAI